MRKLHTSLPRFHLRLENEEKMGSPWVAGTSLRWAPSACSCSKFFFDFFTEGNEGAAALSIDFIFAVFLGLMVKRWDRWNILRSLRLLLLKFLFF